MSEETTTPGDLASVEVLGGDVVRWQKAIDGWTGWMIAKGDGPRTIELRRWQIRKFAEAHLRRSPWKISTDDLVTWMADQNWSTETRRSYRMTFRKFYEWGRIIGHTHRDPAKDLPPIRPPHALPRPAPELVLQDALIVATDRDRLILTLAAYAGLRRAEIATLRWDAIGDRTIRIKGKGDRVRHIPIHPDLQRELQAELLRRKIGGGTGYRYTNGLRGPYVFPGQRVNTHMTPAAVGQAAVRALGSGWGSHSLRHRFASSIYRNTHDLLILQQLLGHSKPETTMRYTELDGDAITAAVNTI